MPYDLFVSPMPHGDDTPWEFVGTYAKPCDARAAITYQGYTRPELRRWALFYLRRTTAKSGILHSQGDYPTKEETHAEV